MDAHNGCTGSCAGRGAGTAIAEPGGGRVQGPYHHKTPAWSHNSQATWPQGQRRCQATGAKGSRKPCCGWRRKHRHSTSTATTTTTPAPAPAAAPAAPPTRTCSCTRSRASESPTAIQGHGARGPSSGGKSSFKWQRRRHGPSHAANASARASASVGLAASRSGRARATPRGRDSRGVWSGWCAPGGTGAGRGRRIRFRVTCTGVRCEHSKAGGAA